jgi:hypothetical protein
MLAQFQIHGIKSVKCPDEFASKVRIHARRGNSVARVGRDIHVPCQRITANIYNSRVAIGLFGVCTITRTHILSDNYDECRPIQDFADDYDWILGRLCDDAQ